MARRPFEGWRAADVAHLVAVQRHVLGFRQRRLDASTDLSTDVAALLGGIDAAELERTRESPSTVHTSTVDTEGLACAVTASLGYGSGVVAPGTGIWLGNPLGEIELNTRPLGTRAPGEPLATNMAPTVVRHPAGAVMAIGSPGAARITTAILQTLVGFFNGMDLQAAIDHPRAHLELGDHAPRVAYEAGMPTDALDLETRRFDDLALFFGGVAAAMWDPARGLVLAGDPRRACQTAAGGA